LYRKHPDTGYRNIITGLYGAPLRSPRMSTARHLEAHFSEHFPPGVPPKLYSCPGRVNLIGEHIDYNGGAVLPLAIERGISVAARIRPDKRVILHSLQRPEKLELDLTHELTFVPAHGWGNYPKGVMKILRSEEVPVPGLELLFDADLPIGAGLSSSAAIEVLTGYALLDQAGIPIDRIRLALLAQRAEQEFIGVRCGIMDQFVVANARAGTALLLECATLAHRHVPFNPTGYALVIMNTNRPRALTESRYNERREECEEARTILRQIRPLKHLVEATTEEAERVLAASPRLLRRVRHVVSEHRRVHQAVTALEQGDWPALGRLLSASHRSLCDDFEVTGPELDAIVAAAEAHPACSGARMTGAGFGGCALALVVREHLADFRVHVSLAYQDRAGLTAEFIVSPAAAGVHAVS